MVEGDLTRDPRPKRRLLGWYLALRVLFITLFLGGTIIFRLSREGSEVLPFLYFLALVSFLHALVSALSLRRIRGLQFFAQTQVAWDLLVCILLVFATGGQESLFSFVFIFVIISASVFLSVRDVVVAAAASSILYGSLVDLQYYGRLPHLPGWLPFNTLSGEETFYSVFVHVAAFLLTALLSTSLAERWRRSEIALQESLIDYQELEQLNRAMLAHISSGLMIVNPAGRVRLLNAAGRAITGYSLEELYNRDIRALFPTLEVMQGRDLLAISRAEARITNKDGQERILGYASNPLQRENGELLGLLVTFQDLTHVKSIEYRLNRADRLAAVGRLAAAMAHEIRNPLAAISGSVQLLMEGEEVSPEDRQLMGIVVREADRLSALLTDFLTYARPRRPELADCDLSNLLDELVEVATNDRRFSRLTIHRGYSGDVRVKADRDQLRQVVFDLLINAAEACGEQGGEIWLAADADAGTLSIEDDGPGIPADQLGKVFEPFFTTKETGTGLGLATVYSIIEAHGGSIEAGNGPRGGARFFIRLPAANKLSVVNRFE